MKVKSQSEVAQSCPTLATLWIAAYQAPPSMGFSRQKYWSGVPLPSLLPNSWKNILLHFSFYKKVTVFFFHVSTLSGMSYNVSELIYPACLLLSHINLFLLSSCPSGVHRPNLGQRFSMLFLMSIHEDHGKDWLKQVTRCLSTLLILICISCPQVILLLLVEDDTLRTTAVVDYNNKLKKKNWNGEFPGGPVVNTLLPMQGAWGWSLVRELRAHMLQLRPGTAK